jgi:hypothetical protein
MAMSLVAGTGVTVSGSVSGSYVIYQRPKTQGTGGIQKDSSGVNFMITAAGGASSGTSTIAAYWKDTLVSSSYHTMLENSSGTLAAWSRVVPNPGNNTTAYYGVSIAFPKNADVCAITYTSSATNLTVTVSAKEDVTGV